MGKLYHFSHGTNQHSSGVTGIMGEGSHKDTHPNISMWTNKYYVVSTMCVGHGTWGLRHLLLDPLLDSKLDPSLISQTMRYFFTSGVC